MPCFKPVVCWNRPLWFGWMFLGRIKSPNSTEEAPVEAELFTFGLKNGLVVEGDPEFILEPFDEI